MSHPLAPGSLVLYKGRPAIVRRIEDRLTIEGEGGDAIKVRPKDVVLLHPGPLASLAPTTTAALDPAEVQAAWEMLAGGQTTLAEPARVTGPGTFFGKATRTLHFEPTTQEGWWFDRTDLPEALPIRVSVKKVLGARFQLLSDSLYGT